MNFIKMHKWLWIYAGVALLGASYMRSSFESLSFVFWFTVCSVMVAAKQAEKGNL